MPAMPRQGDKAKKIAVEILGDPFEGKKPKKKRSKVEERLVFEETARVR